jgi:hypothetical protein
MRDEDYFKRVPNEFDLEEDIKASVWTAQWFVDFGMLDLESALEALKITKAQYEKYAKLPES